MRAVVLLLSIVFVLFLLAGCGGGGGMPLTGDSALHGVWVETAPDSPQPDADGYWPTCRLTLRDDQSFLYEDGSLERWARGTYAAEAGTLRFAIAGTQGAPQFFPAGDITYAILNGYLGMSQETASGMRGMQLARVAASFPAALGTDWLLARRISATHAELPVLDSTRLIASPEGAVELVRSHVATGRYRTNQGRLAITGTGHMIAAFPGAGGAAGALYLLGAYQYTADQLALTEPDGTCAVYAARSIPSVRLCKQWVRQVDGVTERLTLGADGTYRWAIGAGETTGTWRAYRGGYLCLMSTGSQRMYVNDLWAQDTRLTLGTWTQPDGSRAVYQESVWQLAP